MGSEFAYEDLSSFELEKYKFNYIQDDMVDGEPVFLLEQIPTDKNSGYTKQLVWLDKVHYRPLKVEFYDRKSALLKTLTFSEYQVYEDQYWRAHKMLMVNHQSGKSTILNTEEMAFRNGLDDGDFSKNTLKRVR